MAKILIVEDEHALNDLIAMSLKMTGHETVQIYDGNSVLDATKENEFDLIILDVMLPGKSGFEVMDEKNQIGVPVIFLTAKDNVSDKVIGLNLGAEDYITKPFEMIELIARINVVLRRNQKNATTFVLDNLTVYLDEHRATLNGNDIELTLKEFEILELLIINKNIALSREKIIENVWGYDFMGETRSVDVHIQKIRKKLNLEEKIKTIYKYGYRLEAL